MRAVLRVHAVMIGAIALTACALLQPLGGADVQARRAAKVTLAAYETTQQAILIYGRLPTCGPLEASKLCKDKDTWAKIKIVEYAATSAIAEATPVLNGDRADAGELVAALNAILRVRDTVKEAQTKLAAPPPAVATPPS